MCDLLFRNAARFFLGDLFRRTAALFGLKVAADSKFTAKLVMGDMPKLLGLSAVDHAREN